MMGARALPATTFQFVVFPLQVFLTMMLPAAPTSIPRPPEVQWFPSIRLRLPMTWIPAPLPALALDEHALPRITLAESAWMPSRMLLLTVQSETMPACVTTMPLPWLARAVHFDTIDPVAAEMPAPKLKYAR